MGEGGGGGKHAQKPKFRDEKNCIRHFTRFNFSRLSLAFILKSGFQIARVESKCESNSFFIVEADGSKVDSLLTPQETHTLCVFDRLPVVSWRRAKYKQMYGLKSTLTVSR